MVTKHHEGNVGARFHEETNVWEPLMSHFNIFFFPSYELKNESENNNKLLNMGSVYLRLKLITPNKGVPSLAEQSGSDDNNLPCRGTQSSVLTADYLYLGNTRLKLKRTRRESCGGKCLQFFIQQQQQKTFR